MAHPGFKQSPEHKAALAKTRQKILRAKHKLGLKWGDPLPADHPLASRVYDPAKRKANYEKTKATKDTPDSALTPEQLKKRKDNAEYRARKRAEQGKPPPKEYGSAEEGTLARQNPEKVREWQRNYRARKKAEKLGLPVPAKAKRNGHNGGEEVIHDLLPVGKGTISVAAVMARGMRGNGALPPLLTRPGSRADRVLGVVEMCLQLVREELAKE